MNTKIRYTVLTFVFILSVGFFWLAINEYLLQSKAQSAGDFQVVPHARSIECNPLGECYLHILGSTATSNAIAGVTGSITYSEALKPVRVDHSGLCKTSSYGLDTPLQFNDNASTKTVMFSVGALKADSALKGGNGCIATLVFKPVSTTSPQQAQLSLSKPETWKAGGLANGQKTTFKPQIEAEIVNVRIDSAVPLPTGGSLPPTSCTASKGDCNCDNNVDLIDWEALRSTFNNEGASCDFDGNGRANAVDFAIWISNTSLIKGDIIKTVEEE